MHNLDDAQCLELAATVLDMNEETVTNSVFTRPKNTLNIDTVTVEIETPENVFRIDFQDNYDVNIYELHQSWVPRAACNLVKYLNLLEDFIEKRN